MEQPFGHTQVPIAIVGMACRLPGADNLDQYWDLLSRGGSAVGELPPERLDQELYYDPKVGTRGKSYAKLGSIVSSREFDNRACPISAELERGVDNAHLLMCQTAAQACRHAGMDPFNLPLRNTGVYIGHAQGSSLAGDLIYGTCIEEGAQFLREVSGFADLPQAEQDAIIQELVESVRSQLPKRSADSPDVSINMVAGTISKAFQLSGPFLGLNSACASSLQTVMVAARALQLGRIDMAIVGGASDCKGDSLVLFSQAQSMSSTGTRPFDADADGLICAEGYVALVLKTLPRALADGDPIQAIVLGAGMSSDGKGKSLWAPRKEGQVKAMERAYRNGLDMSSLQYIEAHATSTSLGDATELNSLADILADKFPPGKKIPVASVKANIGHALEAAGVSSLIKTVLCLQHRTFVPAINIKALNTKIDWEKVPFYVPLQAAPWPEQPDGLPRRAGVNAFGIGGLNMHVVLEEFTEERRAELHKIWPASTIPSAAGPASEDEQAVAIIGMGCILPGADHPAKLWDLIASGRDPKGPTPAGRWRTDIGHEPGTARAYRTPSILGGYITDYAYDWRKHKQPPKQVQQADPLQFMLLDTADQAIVDAGYDKKDFDRTRVGVLVGTEFGGDFSTQLGLGLRLPHIASLLKPMLARRGLSAADAERITDELAEVMLKHWPALIDESGSFSTSTLASRITKTMNLMGGAAAIDASNTSSAAALAIATDILVSGDCDMMICAGGQRCMNLPQYEGLALSGSLANGDHPAAPFDAAATGIVPGEGVAVVLLKRLGDARRDGDKVHAIIRGIGAAHAEAAEQAIELAINRAMENARVDPADVALVEMDGTGLPERDQDQLRALIATYGKSKRAEPLLVSSITGQIGHTIGASAMVSLVKASLEVDKGQMHATVGLKTPLPVVSQNSGQIQAVTAPLAVRHTSQDGRRLAAVSSYGKGLAYHILLERGEKVAPSQRAAPPVSARQPLAVASPAVAAPPMSAAADCRILRLGAATIAEMTAKIESALADPTRAFAEPTEFIAADRLRLGVVASSADALAKKLHIAATQFANPDAQPVLDQQGCFYRRLPVRRPRVAFVFPGQGSQYPGMLRELVRDVPAARTAMQAIDAVMQSRGYQTFGQMAWERPEQLGADIWVTQVVMLLADLIVHRSLADMQIQPDVVTGHSYGEFAALTAAGVWDFEGVLTAARARYEAIQAISGARGTMMATNAPAALVEQTAARLANRPYIANYNAPDQTVVGGAPEVLAQLAEQLTAARHKCQMLPVPCPFHTPLMEGVGPLLKRTLDTLRMRPPRVPMLSSITNRYVADPDDIRANLAAQLTTPVRYVDLVERIVNEQDTVFVEVGPQQALTKLNRRILEKRSVAGVVACDNPKYPGLEPLYHVRALVECLGLVPSESRAPEKVQVGGASKPASVVGDVRPAAASQPPGKQPTELANARSNAVDQSKPKRGTISHVDATERRIAKMRQKAADGGRTSNGKSGEPTAPSRPEPAKPSGNGPASSSRISPAPRPTASKPAAQPQVPQPVMPVSPAPPPAMSAPRATSPTRPIPAASHSGAASAAQAPAATGGLNATELERFLVNFVVEQTGYPPEVVELDADMEADLGIDSIKKAQLFGELAEYFDVQPGENLTLDDFPTLRHVMNFLVGASAKSSAVGNGAAASVAPTPAPAPKAAASTASMASAAAATPAPAAATGGLNPAELEKFLVNFVVEQTGYPPEVVELDADMEADLGIDSIKKAQLFGELAEYFDVQPGENLTLDDFPTLRHVMNFLVGASAKSSAASNGTAASRAPAAAVSAPAPVAAAPAARAASAPAPAAPAQPVASALDATELERFLVNFVVEQTGYPPEVVELDADMEADLGIDSIKKAQLFGELAEYFDVQPGENLTLDDFPTLRHVMNFLVGASAKSSAVGNGAAASVAPTPAPAPKAAASTASMASAAAATPAPAAATGGLNPAELEKFLVNFVVKQTGYPPEVVELDADMEADLGIDSIKKAQLFGELAEYFDVQPGENLTLDDFPTLRHVMNFLVGSDLKKKLAAGPSEPSSLSLTDPGPVNSTLAEPAQAEPALAAVATIAAQATPITSGELLVLAGTRYEMGLAHGRHKKNEIRRILRRYADLAGAQIDELPIDARSLADPSLAFTSDELDELKGIAAGAGVLFSNIVAHNLAVAADFGTSTLQAAGAGGPDGAGDLLHVSSNDRPLLSALADCVEPVMQVRTPAGGIPHVALSVVGTCGSLGGVNAHGLAVTVGGRTTKPNGAARTSAHALVAGKLLTRADSIVSAQRLAKSLPAGSAWSAILSEIATGQVCAFECDGRSVQVHPSRDKQVLSATSQAGSQKRLNELASVLSSGGGAHDAAERLMANWNPDADEASNFNGAPRIDLIIDAAGGQLWVGKSGRGFEHFSIRDLLQAPIAPLAPPIQPEVESPPFDLGTEEHDQTHRFRLRPRAMPFKPSVPAMPEWQGAALVVGQNEMSRALKRQLESAGVVVRELPETDDVDAAVAALEQIWREQPVPHLFITTGRDDEPGDRGDADVWNRRWRRVALLPYFLCQKWVQLAGSANMLDRTTLVATTRLNGNFGFEGELLAPECGALTGLMKAIYIEVGWMRNNRNMLLKAIDAPDDEPVDQLAANICRELASKTVDYEVAFVRGQRFLQYAYPEPAPTKTHADIRVGGTWVITGGARGITAECALALGRRFKLKLHLVGASPLPHLDERMRNLSTEELKALKTTVMREARAAGRSMDGEWNRVQREIEINQALRRFADAGVEATYHQCDVADASALERVLDAVRRSSGPIEGIVHGAGIERAASYERKSRDAVLATLGAKVDGAMHLIRLTRNDPVRHFGGFGSVSGRLGSNGQTDYCLASDTLCKLANWYKHMRPGVHSVSFHWHPWADVGMAARPESAAMLRITDGPIQMPKEEGVNHFLRELYADTPESEVLITTWEYHGRYYGTEHHPKAGAEQTSPPAAASEPWETFPVKAIALRHELKLVPAPLPASDRQQVRWEGAACILGDNAAAEALADRLVAEGVVVHRLADAGSVDEAVHSIEALYHAHPFRYLFLMTGRDENQPELLDRAGWQARRSRGVDVPFLAAQHWFRLRIKAKDKTPVTIVAATSLGGDFGLSHQVANPEGGAMTGMLKSVFIEDSRTAQREVRVKAIDLPADEPPTAVAEAICRELAGDDPNVEVAYQQGRRSVLRSLVVPVESYPKRKEIHGGTWVVTGGARGITAAAALELGKRFGLKLHLIGRSPVPQPNAPWRGADEQQLSQIKAQVVKQAVNEGRSPEKDWERIKIDMEIDESLRKFAAAGVNVAYHSCDLADWDRLAATLEDIRRADGPIEGIVHGAGYGKSFRFGTRSRDVYERTLAGKLDGAVALMSLTMRDPLRYFLGFGSIGGRFGGNGLSDYAAANDMFAKLCAWFRGRRPDCGVGCLEWQSWDEVGMAMLGDSAVGTKGVLKMDFISPAEGIEHLCRELRAGLPTTEVVITDGFFERTFFPFAVNDVAGEPSTGKAEIGRVPLVEKVQMLDQGPVVESQISFEPGVDPFLLDHQLRGRPLLPAVMALEAMAETASIAGGKPVSAIRDVQLIHGFVFQTERTMPARVRATPQGANTFDCELLSDFCNRAGKLIKKDRVHVQATVDLADHPPALGIAMGQPPSEWRPFEFQNIGPLHHGPSLHGVRATNFNEKGGWGQLVALSLGRLGGPRRARDWIVPATLLDAGFYVCGVHSWFSAEGAFSLPSSLEAVRLGRMPHEDEPCLMSFVCREVTSSHAIYDFDVFGADGEAVLRVEGHRVVMIKP